MTDSADALEPAVELLVADLADEFRERLAHGDRPDPDEFAARHPEHADLIRGVLGAIRLAPTPARPPAEPTPRVIGDFRVVREVGRGGMGVVYEAEQLSLGRRVALKILPFAALIDPRLLHRFHNEARAAAGLDHPQVVKVYGVGQERGVHFIAMQLVDGRPLSDLIRIIHGPALWSPTAPTATVLPYGETHRVSDSTSPGARLSTFLDTRATGFFRRAAELGAQAAEALEHAHSLGVVHRDVKPGNLLLDAQGGVWVSDFGLAKIASADTGVTATGDVFGTLRYMSPEQALAKHDLVDHRTDVYSLGATLYEFLTGRPAVDGKDKADILRRITDAEPDPIRRWNRAVPADLETVVQKCLRKDPADRYPSAKDVADDLRRFLRAEPVRAKPISRARRGARWVGRHPVPVALAGLTALAVLTSFALGVRNSYRAAADQAALQAAAEREERQRFFALLEQVRQRRADPYPGWSIENMAILRELATLPPAGDFAADLRSEVAAALSALDLVPAGTFGPDFPASFIDYSANGRWLAAGQWGALVIRLYDPRTGQTLHRLSIEADAQSASWEASATKARGPMRDRVVSLKFSPDSRWLVAGTGSGRLAVWDMENLAAGPRTWAAHTEPPNWLENIVFNIMFSPDGKTFTSGARSTIRGWHLDGNPAGPLVRGYQLPCTLPPMTGAIPVSDRQDFLYLLDPGTGKTVPETRVDGQFPLSVDPNARLMAFMPRKASGAPLLKSLDPRARPRELSTVNLTPVEMPIVEFMAFDPAGGLLVTLEETARRVKLWDAAGRRLAAEQITLGDCVRAAFTLDGRRVAVSGRHGVDLFDIPNRALDTICLVGETTVASLAATPDHSLLLVLGREEGVPARMYLWRAENDGYRCVEDRPVWPLPNGWNARSISDYSPDGSRYVYSVDIPPHALFPMDGGAWDAKDLQGARFGPDGRLWILEHDLLKESVPPAWTDRVVWRNDAEAMDVGIVFRTLAIGRDSVFVGRRDGRLFRVDPAGGAATAWPLLKTPIAGLALSPDESRLLVGGEGAEVRLVNPTTGEATEIPNAHRGSVPGVAFGRHFFVTGSADRRVRLWTPDGLPLATLRMSGPVKKVLLSNDERSLLVLVEGERAVRRWRLDLLFREWQALGLVGDLSPI